MQRHFMLKAAKCFMALILAGCTTTAANITALPTPAPTITFTPTQVPTASLTPTFSPTPVFANYPWKHVWIKLGVRPSLDGAAQLGLQEEPLFVIYTDGQMIAARDSDPKVRTRILNTREVCNFIERLEFLGFYNLQPAGPQDPANPLYQFENDPPIADSADIVDLTINWSNPKSIQFFEPYRAYLARPMRKTMEFVETYNPGGLTTYQPDRLALFVSIGRKEGTEKEKARPWEFQSHSLAELTQTSYAFLEGPPAAELYAALSKYTTRIYIENDLEYTVTTRIIFPHELAHIGSLPPATPTDPRTLVNCNP